MFSRRLLSMEDGKSLEKNTLIILGSVAPWDSDVLPINNIASMTAEHERLSAYNVHNQWGKLEYFVRE